MSAMPSKVKVGPYTFSVTEDDFTTSSANSSGLFSIDYQRITIGGYLAPDSKADALLHEVLHAIVHLTGIDKDIALDDKEAEERLVSRLSPMLLQLLRDNPKLIAYLVAKS